MKIYDWPTGPYPARVRIALAEKNLLSDVEFVPINLWKGEHKTPGFLARNYSGTLPVLELDNGIASLNVRRSRSILMRLSGNPH
ncbi:glutathione S-transferase N-terminal domain-containing protein [Komagataeibacter rhaeticus]|nr:glutathione S-transferase N-terminal domain-containing protein [Komagataeibacter rhaeticus]